MNPVLPSSNSSASTRAEQVFALFACLFITSLIIARVISEKYFLFMGLPVSCRDIVYPLTFLVINITAEIYGQKQAQALVTHGLSISILVTILLWVARQLPIAASSPISANDFEKVLGSSLSLTISSLVAYLTGQFFNLYLFAWFRKLLGGRHVWLRSTIASLCAQLADTALLAMALYVLGATLESQTSAFSNMLSQYGLKALITFISTPFVYISIALSHQRLYHKTAK